MIPLALTIDDAPTIGAHGAVRAAPERMDAVRAVLQRAGVRSCVAFVIGAYAEGELPRLRRWLDAGYELGNHTYDHRKASGRTLGETVESIRRCDRLLEQAGAFRDGRRRWFRAPYLDRGADSASREGLARALATMGYREVPATIDLFDHRYEVPLARALARGERARVDSIGARFTAAALASVTRVDHLARGSPDRPRRHVGFLHFGEVARVFGADALVRLRANGVRWCDLAEALADPPFAAFSRDPDLTGLAGAGWGRGLSDRVLRRLATVAHRAESLAASYAGPRWPHLE